MIHSSINKIIVSGCSFTNWRRQTTWADRVQQHFDKIDFENQGRPGNSNERIVPGIIDSITKINFGDKNMKIKKSNPKRRKSFRARHKCKTANDKCTARYWSCKAW